MTTRTAAGFQRKTRQRDAVAAALKRSRGPLTAPEILEAAQREVEELGIATVYRAVKSLAEQGLVATVELPGEPLRYEMAHLGHHHHFQCRICGSVFDIDGCAEGLGGMVPPGFKLESHEILLTGECKDCVKLDGYA